MRSFQEYLLFLILDLEALRERRADDAWQKKNQLTFVKIVVFSSKDFGCSSLGSTFQKMRPLGLG